MVIGLGAASAHASRLYAHLTDRTCRFADDLNEIDPAAVDVVVATADRVDAQLLKHLYCPPARSASRGRAPGLIFSAAPDSLRSQVLIRAAARQLSRSSSTAANRVDVLSEAEFASETLPNWRLLGASAAPEDLLEGLQAGATVLVISSHADGVDARLSASQTLCPAETWRAAGFASAPRCALTGTCHRHATDLASARLRGHAVAPALLRAQFLLADFCCGFLDPASVVGPEWRLIDPLLDNATLGAVVTRWKIDVTSWSQRIRAADLFCRGRQVGHALASVNDASATNGTGEAFCLFGDPEMELPPLPRWEAEIEFAPSTPSSTPPPDSVTTSGGMPFLITVMKSLLEHDELAVRSAARSAHTLLETGCNGESLAEAVLNAVRCVGSFSRAWLPCAHMESASSRTICCRVCTSPATSVALRAWPGHYRDIVTCARCGIVADAPAASALPDFSLSPDGTAILDMKHATACEAGGIYLRSHQRSDARWLPLDLDGRARAFRIDLAPHLAHMRGPVVATLYLIDGCDVVELSIPFRAPTAPS
ncbi:hypothetical protein [Cognatazoarcus halotolerans]|uniref:hypothetical protein n=1 Tax=Cognatazoarcus halotolerans TaxID=2686016 RepID=UPI00135A7A31|nr:hypothetical protein [Cognatazoarcus halotolerans]MCP5233480.1 hypothetical protein [Zoogloeaceae bacterium]